MNQKLLDSINRLISDTALGFQFFGEFANFVEFRRDDNIPTAGVAIRGNKMYCYYNDEFINKLSESEVNYLVIHEMKHLIFNHHGRTGTRHRLVSNIATDMIINHLIDTEIPDTLVIQPEGGANLDKEYLALIEAEKAKLIYEDLYDWLLENKVKFIECGAMPQNGFDEAPEIENPELADAIVGEAIENLKQRGHLKGKIEELVNALRAKKHNLFAEIVRQVNILSGNKVYRTYAREHRVINGAKGRKYKTGELNVILDVSGSMHGMFDKVLAYIVGQNLAMNLVMCDTEVRGVKRIESAKDLHNHEIKGLGGTVLQPAFDYIENDKKLKDNNIIVLTDGYTDGVVAGNRKVLVLTTSDEMPIKGNVKQIRI